MFPKRRCRRHVVLVNGGKQGDLETAETVHVGDEGHRRSVPVRSYMNHRTMSHLLKVSGEGRRVSITSVVH